MSVNKVKGTIFFSPLGTSIFGRDCFVGTCCIFPFLLQCACTLWNQLQMHLRYEYLRCWKLVLAVQDTARQQILSSHLRGKDRLFSSWTVTDSPKSQCCFASCFPMVEMTPDIRSIWLVLCHLSTKLWLSQCHHVAFGLQVWAVMVGGY